MVSSQIFPFSMRRIAPNRRLSSQVERGTEFEFRTLEALEKLGFSLRRVGGSDDRGVDLRGTLSLGAFATKGGDTIQSVVVQCKQERKELGPKYVRELEGTLLRETPGTIGILVSSASFTKKALERIQGSEQPIAFGIVESASRVFARFGLNRIAQSRLPGVTFPLTHSGVSLFIQGKKLGTKDI